MEQVRILLDSAISSLKRAREAVGWEEFSDVRRTGSPFARLWQGLEAGPPYLDASIEQLKRLKPIVPALLKWQANRKRYTMSMESLDSKLRFATKRVRNAVRTRILAGVTSLGLTISASFGVLVLVAHGYKTATVSFTVAQILVATTLPAVLFAGVWVSVQLFVLAASLLNEFHDSLLEKDREAVLNEVNLWLQDQFQGATARFGAQE